MESKKSENAQVEKLSGLLMQVGLLIALSTVFMAFKWKSKPIKLITETEIDMVDAPIEVTLSVIEKRMKKPLPKKIQKKIEKKPQGPVVVSAVSDLPFDTIEVDLFSEDSMDFDPNVVMADNLASLPEPPTVDYRQLTKMPEFPGGMEAFSRFLRNNLVYPRFEEEYGISGKVRVQFVIDKEGKVESVEIASKSRKNFSKEALRVAKMIPQWTPGEQLGKKVKCRFEIPITFRTN